MIPANKLNIYINTILFKLELLSLFYAESSARPAVYFYYNFGKS